jgi:polysaccharide deacetylase family sporulation protein PdaB
MDKAKKEDDTMHPKIIAIVVLMLVLAGCGRYTEDSTVKAGIDHGAIPVAMGPVFTNETSPKEATPLSIQAVDTIPTPAANASINYNIKEHVTYSGVRSKEKKVALTFDDGPDTKYTDQILDILKKQKVSATFFVVGEHAAAHKDVMKRIVSNGHELGNHSWDHMDLTKLDEPQLEAELDKTDDIITSITGKPPTLLRPPYGALSKQVIDYSEKSHKIICWSVDTRDWEGISAERILENVKKEVKPGAIILQHSAGGKNGNLTNTIKALPQIIAYLKEQGYQFVTVSNLIS